MVCNRSAFFMRRLINLIGRLLASIAYPLPVNNLYCVVYSTVYATFVILTGSVHSTCAFQLGLPLIEWTDPIRMTKVAYTVEYTTIWVV